uniref:Bacterial surface antigen (D15) domain-containing protein n=1 Tax=Aegilops tauschii subsp. strangulata TaxID=200361 RepID=A0A453FUS9_AEGTS
NPSHGDRRGFHRRASPEPCSPRAFGRAPQGSRPARPWRGQWGRLRRGGGRCRGAGRAAGVQGEGEGRLPSPARRARRHPRPRRHHQGQFQDPRLPHRGGGRRPAPLCRHRAGPGARLQPCQRAAAPPRRVRLRLHHPRRRPARVPRYCNRHHPSRGGGQTLQSWHLLLPQERGEYGWDQSSKIDIGVYLPRLKSIPTPLTARASILSEDWLKFSSYKQRLLGLKFGLLSTWHHNLSYDLAWRTLTDPSQMASESIRRQLGHNLLSALSYAYKIDKRDSEFRPTKGYAFVSTSQVGGLWKNGLRFFRQVLMQPTSRG